MPNRYFRNLNVTGETGDIRNFIKAIRTGSIWKRTDIIQFAPLILLLPILLLLFIPKDIAEPLVTPIPETRQAFPEAVTEHDSIPTETEFIPTWTEEEVSYLTKTVYGSAGTVPSLTEQSAVVWCILNWCDLEGESIIYEITYPNRFQGYQASNPEPEHLRELVIDVLTRWQREKEGEINVGRTLPPNYYFFTGDGEHNHFRTAWEYPYATWNWSLPSPYEN